jgi:uncharacterized Ntn-hydrolase superfamily protein
MKFTATLICILLFQNLLHAQDTFSICAYDSLTGQLGSAGATCIQAQTSALIISDLVPGVGVVHTQAAFLQQNRSYAHSLLLLGLPPQQIIDSMIAHDYAGDPSVRQYGVVDAYGHSAGFTGINCMDYKNHLTGPGYSIQGNILLGQVVLDSMESRFLNTPGDLACRLMSAMQGAKMVGADTRCTNLGISSVSAFIRVANPGDTGTTPFYLNISLNTYPNYTEPIDSLQERFDLWGGCTSSSTPLYEKNNLMIFPNPVQSTCTIRHPGKEIQTIELFNSMGSAEPLRTLSNTSNAEDVLEIDTSKLSSGIYYLRARTSTGKFFSTKILKL